MDALLNRRSPAGRPGRSRKRCRDPREGWPRRILLLEDDESLRLAVAIFLGARGYDIEEVADLAAADSVLRSEDFDLAVLDRSIAGSDSIELLRRWRDDGIATPAIFVTAMASEEERIEGLRSGAADYLVKPFSLVELGVHVDVLLGRPAPPPPAAPRA